MFYTEQGGKSLVKKLIVGTGGVTKGCLCVVSSNTVVKAAAAPSAATVVGIALETASASATAAIEFPANRIIRAKYTGSSKTSLADADLTKVFDLSDENTVNLDDTTGGCCFCVGYDNTNSTIDFMLTEASKIV